MPAPIHLAITVAAAALWGAATQAAQADVTTITIATVNNAQMIEMQKLSPSFERLHPDIHVNWVILEENVLRQRVTTDIATHGGQFDVLTIGNYEVPIWAKQKWIVPFDDLPASYDAGDIIPAIREGVSYQGKIYGLPFYGDGGVTYYRADLFRKAGLTMPEEPTYEQIRGFADKLNDKAGQVYGICLRGKPGWGENMSTVTPLVTAMGGQYFDMQWKPTIDTPAWHAALKWYVDALQADGPPGSTSNGFNETLALFTAGRCGMWIDASNAAGGLNDPKTSKVAGNVGLAAWPSGSFKGGPGFLWSWNLSIPASSTKVAAAKSFVEWATSKEYIQLVAATDGWVNIPPGTRTSSYMAPEYKKVAPFSDFVLKAIGSSNPNGQTANPRPYVGPQFVSIPQFQAIGTNIGQMVAAALSGDKTVDQALEQGQAATARAIREAGYAR